MVINMYKEDFPSPYQELIEVQPASIRVFHWLNFFLISLLIITGYYLHAPGWFEVKMKTIKLWHFVAAYLLVANYVVSIYYYIYKKYYHSIIFKVRDIKHLPSFIKYAFFLEESHPFYGKYNPGQKIIYSLWVFLNLFMIITGFALYSPGGLDFLTFFLGELSQIRLLHFLGTLLFSLTIPIHIYFALTEDPAKLQAIFSGYLKK